MASERDHQAAELHRQRWSYDRIAERFGYPERRAAHRGVLRALAESAAEEAQLRALRVREADDQLLDVQRRLLILLERYESNTGQREYLRIFDALFRVVEQRCRVHGLFVHPWRCDQWWRRDMPPDAWAHLQWQANRLEREARIPLRWRQPSTATPRELAPIIPLRPAPVPSLIDVEALVPATVRRLLDQATG